MKEQTNSTKIGEIVIVGGGPIGNFCAVMSGLLGIKTTVYQKRAEYTRQINVRIQPNFFKEAGNIAKALSWNDDIFMNTMEQILKQHGHKIQIKKLETLLREKAESFGIIYQQREIKTFQEAEKLCANNPLILDCTGRKSLLRVNHFGEDHESMKIHTLSHAVHINFDADNTTEDSFAQLYAVIKHMPNLKLGQIVASKSKDKDSKSIHVTVPLFVTGQLSQIFDKYYPDINRNPIRPFVSKNLAEEIPQEIALLVDSVFCSLLMRGWKIQWETVAIKKIVITCGYAINRSSQRYICLGDSATHFAYYRSLNFGLETAFDFFKMLASYPNLEFNRRGKFNEKQIVNQSYRNNPHLWIVGATQSPSMNSCIIRAHFLVSRLFKYNLISKKAEFINFKAILTEDKVPKHILDYKNKLMNEKWEDYLEKFEDKRLKKIKNEINSNKFKSNSVELTSYLIWMNKQSPIKVSETYSFFKNGYWLDYQDFEYFFEIFNKLKNTSTDSLAFTRTLGEQVKIISEYYEQNGWKSEEVKPIIISLKILLENEKNVNWRQLDEIMSKAQSQTLKLDKKAIIFIHCLSTIVGIWLQEQQSANINESNPNKQEWLYEENDEIIEEQQSHQMGSASQIIS